MQKDLRNSSHYYFAISKGPNDQKYSCATLANKRFLLVPNNKLRVNEHLTICIVRPQLIPEKTVRKDLPVISIEKFNYIIEEVKRV